MDYELMMNGTVKIGQRAPDFTAETTYGPVCLDDYKGKWLVLFSHPGDFTPVNSPSLGVCFSYIKSLSNNNITYLCRCHKLQPHIQSLLHL